MTKRSIDSFGRFYSENISGVRRFVARLIAGGPEAEDVANQAFANTFQARTAGRDVEHKAYVYAAARNLAGNLHRRAAVRGQPDDPDALIAQEADPGGDAEAVLIARERLELLKAAFATLTPMQQQVILLRKLEGLKIKEIADRVGMSVSSVEKLIRGGLRTLQDHLDAREEPAGIDRALQAGRDLDHG